MRKNKTKIIIFGGKGTAVNIAEGIWDAEKNYNANIEFMGFAFDDEDFGDTINGFPVLCKTKEAFEKFGKYKDVKFIFQMNNPHKMIEREMLIKSYDIPLEKWGNFIHPSAYISKSVKLGVGNVIFINAVVHANVEIMNHTTILAQTTIGHDSIIGNHTFTATHVCIGSSVYTSKNVFIGQNATIKEGVNIESNTIVGASSNVINNIDNSNKIYVGSPAKAIKNIN